MLRKCQRRNQRAAGKGDNCFLHYDASVLMLMLNTQVFKATVNSRRRTNDQVQQRRPASPIPQATKWQHIGNQINAAMIFARADFVNVHREQ
jgi:hypothetical protein